MDSWTTVTRKTSSRGKSSSPTKQQQQEAQKQRRNDKNLIILPQNSGLRNSSLFGHGTAAAQVVGLTLSPTSTESAAADVRTSPKKRGKKAVDKKEAIKFDYEDDICGKMDPVDIADSDSSKNLVYVKPKAYMSLSAAYALLQDDFLDVFPNADEDDLFDAVRQLKRQDKSGRRLSLGEWCQRIGKIINAETTQKAYITSEDNCDPEDEDDEECGFCYDNLGVGDVLELGCGHKFHDRCIRQWCKIKRECPFCRTLICLDDEFPTLWIIIDT